MDLTILSIFPACSKKHLASRQILTATSIADNLKNKFQIETLEKGTITMSANKWHLLHLYYNNDKIKAYYA